MRSKPKLLDAPTPDAQMREQFLRLQERVRLLEAVIDYFPGGIILTDENLNVVVCNQQQRQLLDYPSTLFEACNPALRELFHFNAARGEYGPGDVQEIVANKLELVSRREPHVFERTKPNGRIVEIRGTPLPGGGFVTSYIDVTENRQNQSLIAELALRDSLTGLANRNLLKQRIEQEIARARRGEGFAIHYIDLDHFKPINDQYGDAAGDLVLVEIANRLRTLIRETDTAARIGGDEFVIVQTAVSLTDIAAGFASRLGKALAQPIDINGIRLNVGASIGVVLSGQSPLDMDELLRRADAALYDCKRQGRNQFQIAQQ